MGSIPGKSDHSKEYCNAIISTAFGTELSDYEKEVDEIERLLYENEIGQVRRQIVAKAKAHVGRFEIQVVERVEEKVVQPVGHKAEKPVNGKALSRSWRRLS